MNIDQGWATVVAATVAAVFALVNTAALIILDRKRRQAQVDQGEVEWMRQQLHHHALTFLDACFDVAGLSRRLAGIGHDVYFEPPEETKVLLLAAHDRLKHAQTALRILSGPELVAATESCHAAHDRLFEMAFDTADPLRERMEVWQSKGDQARFQRENFITLVRQPLGLTIFEHKISRTQTKQRQGEM